MKTIKKACKGTLYPKASSVSKKLKKGGSFDLNKDGKTTFKDVLIGRGVLPKTAKKGTKVKKAQDGYDDKLRYPKDAIKSYDESNNPKIKLVRPNSGSRLVDTSGFAAGRKIFPTKSTKPVPGSGYGKAKRKDVEKSIKASKNKNGGMTKKCKYGCK